MPDYRDDDRDVVRVRSLPLPTRTAYRLTVPMLPRESASLSIVHAHSPFVTGWLGQRAAKRDGVPLVFTYHTQLDQYAHYVPFESRLTRSAATRLTRAFANAADAVVVPTETMRRRLRDVGVRSRIEVVPSGIDVDRFARGERSAKTRAAFGAGTDDKLVLTVGRLGREKNVELVLEAFARLNDPAARLVAIGDGPHREMLERLAERTGLAARVRFTGELAREALPDAYASADAFLFASRTETQGLVLVEALAARLPIVAVDTPQTRDVVGDHARLVAEDPLALAAALRETLACDVTPGVPASAAAAFDRTALGDRIIALYASLVAERARAPVLARA